MARTKLHLKPQDVALVITDRGVEFVCEYVSQPGHEIEEAPPHIIFAAVLAKLMATHDEELFKLVMRAEKRLMTTESGIITGV